MAEASIIKLPTTLTGWANWYPIDNDKSYPSYREFWFPPNMLPSTQLSFYSLYNNTTLLLATYDQELANTAEAGSALPMLGGLLAVGAGSQNIQLLMEIKRSGSFSSATGNDTVEIPTGSPYLGFSIGNIFKHQAWLSMQIGGFGITGPAFKIIWLTAACDAEIEYTTNSKFTKFVVSQGKAGGVKTVTTNGNSSLHAQLFSSSNPAVFNGIPSGNITFYGLRETGYVSQSFQYVSIDSDWSVVINDLITNNPTKFVPVAGDFYILDKPIMADNPQTIHEFNLTTDSDGMYMTNEQRYSLPNTVVGIWVYDKTASLWNAYVEPNQQSRVILSDNDGEVTISGENKGFKGNLVQGQAAWVATSKSSSTVRLILSSQGGTPTQNFFAGNLVGEYIKSGKEYFLIVDHPRLDTIEIQNASVTSGTLFLNPGTSGNPTMPTSITIYQQNFWKITELYTYGTTTGSGPLWGGTSSSVTYDSSTNTSIVKWNSIESFNALFLPSQEISKTGYSTLAERFRSKVNLSGVAAINGYNPYAGWILNYNGTEFNIQNISFSVSSGSDKNKKVSITTTVSGSIGSTTQNIYVTLGNSYKNPYGIPQIQNPYFYAKTDIALIGGQYCLNMYGYYSPGAYRFDDQVGTTQRFSVAESSFYGESSGNAAGEVGNPSIWTSASSGLAGICFMPHGALDRQTVLYNDPELGILTAISSDPGWIERRQKATIRCGSSNQTMAGATVPENAIYLTKMWGIFTPSSTPNPPGFWVTIPPNAGNVSPYSSVVAQGYGGIDTPILRQFGLSITTTTAHPVNLPIETYVPPGTTNQVSLVVPAAAKISNITLSKCGFDAVTTPSRFNSVSSGNVLPSITPSVPATSLEFSMARQVLSGIGLFDCHALSDGRMILFYGKKTGTFSFSNSISVTNISLPGVFVIKSNTDLDNWGSPKFDMQQLIAVNNIQNSEEWERPMLLEYDFTFAGSIQLTQDTFMLFGYGYSWQGTGTSGSSSLTTGDSADGVNKNMFLGCYIVSSSGMQLGTTYKCYSTPLSSSDDLDVFFYYRPKNVVPSFVQYDMNFGVPIKGLPTSNAVNPGSSCIERFTKIIGGSSSGSLISQSVSQEVIGMTISISGLISLYLHDPSINRIFRVISNTSGITWYVEVDNARKPIYYASGSCPTIFSSKDGDLLFYYSGNVLYCKNLYNVSEGVFDHKQEVLDNTPASVVSTNAIGSKIAVNIDPQGRVFAFYSNQSGYVQAAVSNTSGKTWGYLANW